MCARLEKLERLKEHPWIGRDFSRLTKSEPQEVIAFIQETSAFSDDDYL